MHSGHVALAAGPNSGVRSEPGRVKRTTYVWFEGGFTVCPPGKPFVRHGRPSRSICDGASDEGFRGATGSFSRVIIGRHVAKS